MVKSNPACPCGDTRTYSAHCQTVHTNGAGLGVSAESLMRARYSAYVMHNADFLLETWHPDTRPEQVDFDSELQWLGLEILDTDAGSGLDTNGVVEFRARFTRGGEFLELHERSTFVRVEGRWVYVSGGPGG